MMRSEHHTGMHSFHNILISKSALVSLNNCKEKFSFFPKQNKSKQQKNASKTCYYIVGICGETSLSNERRSIVTMMQVSESTMYCSLIGIMLSEFGGSSGLSITFNFHS